MSLEPFVRRAGGAHILAPFFVPVAFFRRVGLATVLPVTFAPFAQPLVAEIAAGAIRVFGARAKVNPDGESTGDEALQKHYSDRYSQEPVLPPRRRVRANKSVVNGSLVKAVRFTRREVVQRRTYCILVGSLRGRSILGLLVVQRRRLCVICLHILGVVSWAHLARSHAQSSRSVDGQHL